MRRLSEKEEAIMQALWALEHAFVKELLAELPEPKPPITTVSSIIRKLEAEGIVGHEAFGKTHRYYPILTKEEFRKSYFQRLMDDYFGGSPESLLSFFVKEEEMDPQEIQDLLDRIKDRNK
jgi:predicted transcriptional regulator